MFEHDIPAVSASNVDIIKRWAKSNKKYEEELFVRPTKEYLKTFNIWEKDGIELSDAEAVENYGLDNVIYFCTAAADHINIYYKCFQSNIKSKLLDKGFSAEKTEGLLRVDFRSQVLKKINFALPPDEAATQFADFACSFLR